MISRLTPLGIAAPAAARRAASPGPSQHITTLFIVLPYRATWNQPIEASFYATSGASPTGIPTQATRAHPRPPVEEPSGPHEPGYHRLWAAPKL